VKTFNRILSLLVFVGLVSACGPPAGQVLTPPATAAMPTALPQPSATLAPSETSLPTPTQAPIGSATPTAIVLTVDALRNMQYNLPVSQKTVKLVNGQYEAGSGADYLLVKMADPIALGDINGDGLDDGAVILGENMGGSGVFESLIVVLDEGSVPTQWAATQIGDRVKVNTVTIQDHQVILEMVVPGPNDPACCPSLGETQAYNLTKGGLFLTGLTSQPANGAVRAIKINGPLNYADAGTSVEVQGGFSFAPFENTLTYTIQDDTHHVLDQGSFQVKPDTSGGSGTFDTTIDLSKSSPGMIIHLDIQGVSAADASILALGSVELTRK